MLATEERRRSPADTAPLEGDTHHTRAPGRRTIARSARLAPLFRDLRAVVVAHGFESAALYTMMAEQHEAARAPAAVRCSAFLEVAAELSARLRELNVRTGGGLKELALSAPATRDLARLAARCADEALRLRDRALAPEVKP